MDANVNQLLPTSDRVACGPSAARRNPRDQVVSTRARWTGRIVSGIPSAFLLFDAALKLAKPTMVVEGTVKLGYPAQVIVPLGLVLLSSTLAYLVPRTAVLGAILLTAISAAPSPRTSVSATRS